MLIVAAAMACLVLAAAGGGLLVWLLLPRSAAPLSNNPAPAVASNEESKQTPKEPSAEEVKAQQELQAAHRLSRKNLRELALAFQNHADTFQGQCPPAMRVGRPRNPPPPGQRPAPQPLLSWRVLILPFVGEDKLYREFKLDEPWDGPNNKNLLAKMPKIFAPVRGKTAEPYTTYYQVFVTADGFGTQTPFLPPWTLPVPPPGGLSQGGPRFPASITDGTSNTFLIVEAGEPVPWTKPADLEYNPKKPLPKLGGPFPDGFHAVAFDGQVYFVGRDYPEKDLRRWITCNDGEIIETELKPLSDKDEAPAAPEAPKPAGQPPKSYRTKPLASCRRKITQAASCTQPR